MLLKQTKNWAVKIGFIAMTVFVLGACASAPKGESKKAQKAAMEEEALYPPTIQKWITENKDAYYGVGIFTMDGSESFSVSQARTRAFGELSRSVEVSAAYIGKSYEEAGGAAGSEGTKNRASSVLRGARTVGPVKANGNMYILQYIPRNEFDSAMKEAALESRAKISEADLDKLLDDAQAKGRQ